MVKTENVRIKTLKMLRKVTLQFSPSVKQDNLLMKKNCSNIQFHFQWFIEMSIVGYNMIIMFNFFSLKAD